MAQLSELLERFFYRRDEVVADSLALAPEIEGQLEEIAAEVPEEFLAFELEGETYAIPIAVVREILKVPVVTEVPRAADNVLGLMNVRGDMVPLCCIKQRLRLSGAPRAVRGPSDVPRAARVVLIRDPQGDTGVLVDRVHGVVKLKLSKLETPPTLGGEPDCVAGLGRRDEQLYILLDIERALS